MSNLFKWTLDWQVIKCKHKVIPRWSMNPVAAVPKTPASTPAVFDSPSNTPCN